MKNWPVPLLLPLLGACASYPQKVAPALRDFERGHLERAMTGFEDIDSPFLSGAEAGTVALAAGRWDDALAHLHRAADAAKDLVERALLSPAALGEGLASFGLSDVAKPYHGEGFERVYVHSMLAMAYLAKGLLDDVFVEVRRANAVLEAEEELYESKYRAGGLGHLLSAVAYELLGELDDAMIDYRRMVEKEVGTELAGRALVRLANQLGWSDEAERWETRFGPDLERPDGAASVVLVAGIGRGPVKVGGTLPVPTGSGIVAVSASVYESRPSPVSALRIGTRESGVRVRTDVVERVDDVARANLKDRQLWLLTKSVARGLLKRELTQELERQAGVGGRLAGDLFAFFSERPDLRAWLTLPSTWQAARLFLPPGEHALVLEAIGGGRSELGTFELDPGETMVVLAREAGGRLHAHAIGGRRIAPPPAAPAPASATTGAGENAPGAPVPTATIHTP